MVHRHPTQGSDGIRHRLVAARRPRRPRLLSPEQLHSLADAVQGPEPGRGLWTGPLGMQWITEGTGREHLAPYRGHDYVKSRRMSPRRSRPRFYNVDSAAQPRRTD